MVKYEIMYKIGYYKALSFTTDTGASNIELS